MNTENTQITEITGTPVELESLIRQRGGVCATLYLPISQSRPQSEQNPALLRNLINEAKEQLVEVGLEEDKADDMLAPVKKLEKSPEELLRHAQTLVFFIDEASIRLLELPYPVEAQAHVSNMFFTKLIFPLKQMDTNYTVLCLNRGHVGVFEGTVTRIKAIQVPDMPEKLEDVTHIDDPEKSIQSHTAKTTSATGGPGTTNVAQTHGQGLPSDIEQSQFKRFFREVAKSLHAHLANKKDTIILFGVQENIGFFKSEWKWSNRPLLAKITDPHQWNSQQILEESVKLIKPQTKEKTQRKLERLVSAKNRDHGIFEPAECSLAASSGRIELVAVATDLEMQGICNPAAMEVEIIEEGKRTCAHDLYDYIASETIRNGGEVIALENAAIPGGKGVAAITRF